MCMMCFTVGQLIPFAVKPVRCLHSTSCILTCLFRTGESCAVQFQLSLQLSTDWNFMFVVCKYIVRNCFKTIFVPQNVAVNHSRDILEQQVLIYIVLYMNYFYIVDSVLISSRELYHVWCWLFFLVVIHCQICCIALCVLQTSKQFWVFLFCQLS